jgi:hypothetical protein
MINLASKKCGANLTSKGRLLHVSRFTKHSQPPCVTRVTSTHTFASHSEYFMFATSKEWHMASCVVTAKLQLQQNSSEILNLFPQPVTSHCPNDTTFAHIQGAVFLGLWFKLCGLYSGGHVWQVMSGELSRHLLTHANSTFDICRLHCCERPK